MAQSSGARILMFQNKKYKEEDFVVPAQDTKGHSERLYFRVQPGHARELAIILASKKFPFRTQGDIGRLAIKLVVDMLKGMEPMPSVAGQVDAIIKIVRDEEFHQEFVSMFESAQKTVDRYVGSGETGRARNFIIMLIDEIAKMPKGYWREKYTKEVKQKFGHLVKGAGLELLEVSGDEAEEAEGPDQTFD